MFDSNAPTDKAPHAPGSTPTVQIKAALIGSISEATLRTQDLLKSFMYELESQLLRNGNYFCRPENFGERDRLNNLVGECQDAFTDDGDEIRDDCDGEALVSELEDALQTFAAPYCYFGATCGDGACFGYWPSIEQIDELPTVNDSDEARELGEDCKSVNDHGNVTVYGGDGSIIIAIV